MKDNDIINPCQYGYLEGLERGLKSERSSLRARPARRVLRSDAGARRRSQLTVPVPPSPRSHQPVAGAGRAPRASWAAAAPAGVRRVTFGVLCPLRDWWHEQQGQLEALMGSAML
ncbi:hypothetical protein NDU88_001570 [Pleurodeles waltl]|uniref:Uncharacterized protein n=1 Tax=Pleurodeles waltl TaxID=8319 RepID=A0AAV7RBZ5_PLEWA|nr:hypothetical protein NDU88_001570 [Pleurodeles waltl]